ncbi:MAG: cobalt ABC transporter ATP-binding protein [Thermodesulfovibrio sp.]|nr:cobalt ABC transporter ATP-binding protein [Thermodesulfovibrio sp.]
MSHHIVEFRDVYFQYPDGTEPLSGLSFRITHGESVGIVGANGAGKSTLLLHMNGCLLATKGTIDIGDDQMTKETRREIRKKVGMVFQNPDDQLFMPTVFDDVAFGPLNLGLAADRVKERVEASLERVGGLALMHKAPHHLSGGQKSAVAIASVIAMQPDILVMDEPASSLDPRARRSLINLLNDFEHTKIIASHDLDLILDVCDRCIVIKNGKVMADGPSEQILSDRALMEENHLELPLSLQGRTNNRKRGGLMKETDKLNHLIGHWLEHNREHAATYGEWGNKAAAAGKPELAAILKEIAQKTADMDALFQRAAEACK